MTKEEMALELYPVKFQGDVKRAAPDKNLPLRKAFIKGFDLGTENPACPWKSVMAPPASPGLVLVWCVDDVDHEAPMMARYTGEDFDLMGIIFWIPVFWMPIPAVPEGLKKEFYEI